MLLSARVSALALCVAGLLFCSSSAIAAPFTYSFSGNVTQATGIFAGAAVGDVVSGIYTVDTDIQNGSVDNVTANPGLNSFFSNDIAQPIVSGSYEISVTAGGVTRTTASNAVTSRYTLKQWDLGFRDEWLYSALGQAIGDDFAALNAVDFTPSPPDGLFPGSGNLTGVPILAPGALALYDSVTGEYAARGPSNALEGELSFDITSITIIPEPGTALLLGLGLAGLAGVRRRD